MALHLSGAGPTTEPSEGGKEGEDPSVWQACGNSGSWSGEHSRSTSASSSGFGTAFRAPCSLALQLPPSVVRQPPPNTHIHTRAHTHAHTVLSAAVACRTCREAGRCSGLIQSEESRPAAGNAGATQPAPFSEPHTCVQILFPKTPNSPGITLGFAGGRVLGEMRELKINHRVRGGQL